MALASPLRSRVSVAGKFFRLDDQKFYVKGLTYGPFQPDPTGQLFASPEQTAKDFERIRLMGANVVRLYQPPPRWLLDLAIEHKLKLFVDIPWNSHLCFLDSASQREAACHAIRRAVFACARHPAIFAYSVANELSPDILRWSGARAVADFIDSLIQEGRRVDPDALFTFANFPPTEFLRPQGPDFLCFNLYLHQRPAFSGYLARLQMLAESKPLLLGELGVDSLREGEPRKAEMLSWQIEGTFRAGLAGAVVFSYTDDWWREGEHVEGWQMGLTTPQREPKESARRVERAFGAAPYFPLPRYPKVSVIVASYNAERTLQTCLESLERLNYPDYEVILVDDGSRDTTRQIAFLHPAVRYIEHEKNLGLSVARNSGLGIATGEIVAFTDADCRADEDWLYYLVGGLLDGGFEGIGGPNLMPPEDSSLAAAVLVSPGGPAHVMLTDRQAEHIPGCNMAFFKDAIDEVGGFDPIFHQAGDDVDLCWRLQQAGFKLGFSSGAFVWHYRRSTLREYLKQQHGYGEAEALLVRKHPGYFNWFGGSLWRGRIYATSNSGLLLRAPMVYRGLFGSAGFQSLYASQPALSLMLCTTLEYYLLVVVPLWILSAVLHHLLPLAITALLLPLGVCAAAGAQASLPKAKKRPWSRPLVALLFFLQPIARGWARYQGQLLVRPAPLAARQTLDSIALRDSHQPLNETDYWSPAPVHRLAFIAEVLGRLEQQGWPHKADIGWCDYDVEIYGGRWTSLQLVTVVEDHSRDYHLLRCRLRGRWSLPARAAFALLAGVELLALGFFGRGLTWLWLILLALPLLAWLFRRQQRSLQSLLIVFLDELAKQWKLAKPAPPASPPRPETIPAGPSPFAPETRQRDSGGFPAPQEKPPSPAQEDTRNGSGG
ncbi:MAG TPA: glycosyltransferase [Verrucomicrobiae bacterium]|nr:glycosyltransferase [Verrucomicrobiae bacterium]